MSTEKWSRPKEAARVRPKVWKRRAAAVAAEVVWMLLADEGGDIYRLESDEQMSKFIGGIVYTAACKVLRAPAPPLDVDGLPRTCLCGHEPGQCFDGGRLRQKRDDK